VIGLHSVSYLGGHSFILDPKVGYPSVRSKKISFKIKFYVYSFNFQFIFTFSLTKIVNLLPT
jgi:hypothetical protein